MVEEHAAQHLIKYAEQGRKEAEQLLIWLAAQEYGYNPCRTRLSEADLEHFKAIPADVAKARNHITEKLRAILSGS